MLRSRLGRADKHLNRGTHLNGIDDISRLKYGIRVPGIRRKDHQFRTQRSIQDKPYSASYLEEDMFQGHKSHRNFHLSARAKIRRN
jgi:hypothetical protein